MIPAIGVMIAAYIVTRMVEIFTKSGEQGSGVTVKIFAGVTILVAVVSAIDILNAGSRISP